MGVLLTKNLMDELELYDPSVEYNQPPPENYQEFDNNSSFLKRLIGNKFGLWSDKERLLKEIANEKKRKKEMYDKNPEQIHPRNIYSSGYQNGGLIKEAQNVASKGRYGDTMLMHVNPKEVEGLASIMPITINPETGQPEAFIGAILGSLLGGAFLPGLAGGTWLTAAGGAAIGSGLGTWAETGDLEKGIASAVLGYGVGSVMGDVATTGIEAELTEAAMMEAGEQAAQKAIFEKTALAGAEGLTPQASARIGQFAREEALKKSLTQPQLNQIAQGRIDAYGNMTGGERLSNMGSNLFSTDTLDSMASNYLPVAIGGGSLGAQNAQDQYLEDMEQYRLDKEKRRKELLANNPEQIHRRNPYYSMYNSNAGGQIPSYANGETIAGIGPEGQFTPSNTYMPGIDSEFNYFPNRVIPSSAISAAQAAAKEAEMAVMPNPRASVYQPMVLPNYEDPAAGSVLQRVNQARAAGLPATTQLLSPFRNVGLEGVTQAANPIAFNTTGTTTNTDETYDVGGGKTNDTDDDLTNNSGSTVTDNNDGTSTVTFKDGTTTEVANNPYAEAITVTSNTDPVTGLELVEGDEGYVDPNSEDYSEATYDKGTGGGPHGFNPYLGEAATTYEQVEENRETVLDSATETGLYQAYDAAIQAGIPAADIVIPTVANPNPVITDDTVIVGSTGYGKPGSLEDGTFVYTNTDPLKGIVDSNENFYPGEKREATAGILISPDGTRTDITDLSTFSNPGDGSVIELNNGYTVVNDPNNGVNNYARVGVYANDPSYGGLHERDPAVFAPQFSYKTLTREQKDAALDKYQQAVGDAIARGDIPAPANTLYPDGYEEYLAQLEAEAEEETEEETETEVTSTAAPKAASTAAPKTTIPNVIEIPESAQSVIDKLGETFASPKLPFSMSRAEGGLIEMQAGMEIPSVEQIPQQQELQEQVIAAVLGQHSDPDSVIQAFIQQFGVDAFLQLRDQILKQQVPNAQTEGMIQGEGGGMDDLVMGQIGNQSAVAVSPGEYIVPADVVSMLGDGSSDNGSDKLDDMLSKVRITKTGTKNQAKPLGNKKVMSI